MKIDLDGTALDIGRLLKSIPRAHYALSFLGGLPGMTGLMGLTLRPRLKRRLLEDLAGNEQATAFLHWIVIPQNALLLIGVGALLSIPMMRSAMAAAKEQLR